MNFLQGFYKNLFRNSSRNFFYDSFGNLSGIPCQDTPGTPSKIPPRTSSKKSTKTEEILHKLLLGLLLELPGFILKLFLFYFQDLHPRFLCNSFLESYRNSFWDCCKSFRKCILEFSRMFIGWKSSKNVLRNFSGFFLFEFFMELLTEFLMKFL